MSLDAVRLVVEVPVAYRLYVVRDVSPAKVETVAPKATAVEPMVTDELIQLLSPRRTVVLEAVPVPRADVFTTSELRIWQKSPLASMYRGYCAAIVC